MTLKQLGGITKTTIDKQRYIYLYCLNFSLSQDTYDSKCVLFPARSFGLRIMLMKRIEILNKVSYIIANISNPTSCQNLYILLVI